MLLRLILPVIIGFTCYSCSQPSANIESKDNQIVASVGNRVLTVEQVNTMIHSSASSEDSIAISNAYIDSWIRNQVMMKEASMRYATDIEIERLVDNYRENLLKYRLEEDIISERLDTSITYNELFAFYNEQKKQFPLSEDLFRILLIELPEDSKAEALLNKAWKAGKTDEISKIADSFVLRAELDTSRWITWTDISDQWTEKFDYPNQRSRWSQRKKQDKTEYFLKVYEKMDKGEFSPLSYIDDQLILMLMHKRKKEVINVYNEELYDKALRNNEIKL